MKVKSRSDFLSYLNEKNLACRQCSTQQLAEIVLVDCDDEHYLKRFDCLKCKQKNFELVRHFVTFGRSVGSFPAPNQHFVEVLAALPAQNRRFVVPDACPENVASDYKEAAKLIYISPVASAAFARRCLQTLLRSKGYEQKDLIQQIKAMLAESDPKKILPHYIATQIDAVRNFGNFSAHEMRDKKTDEILDVEPEEAEWCLSLIEGLIEYYWIKLEQERRKIEALNEKLISAGKPPILQPPDGSDPAA